MLSPFPPFPFLFPSDSSKSFYNHYHKHHRSSSHHSSSSPHRSKKRDRRDTSARTRTRSRSRSRSRNKDHHQKSKHKATLARAEAIPPIDLPPWPVEASATAVAFQETGYVSEEKHAAVLLQLEQHKAENTALKLAAQSQQDALSCALVERDELVSKCEKVSGDCSELQAQMDKMMAKKIELDEKMSQYKANKAEQAQRLISLSSGLQDEKRVLENRLSLLKQPLPSMLCPITHELMVDPVVLIEDGHSYEKDAICGWMRRKLTSPITNQPLSTQRIVHNYALRDVIQEWQRKLTEC